MLNKKYYFRIFLLILISLIIFYVYKGHDKKTFDLKEASSIKEISNDSLITNINPDDQKLKKMLLSNNSNKVIEANNIIKEFTPERISIFIPELLNSIKVSNNSWEVYSYRNIKKSSQYSLRYIKNFIINGEATKNQTAIISGYLGGLGNEQVNDIADILEKANHKETLYRAIALGIVSNKKISYENKKLLVSILLKSQFKNSSNIIVATQIFNYFNDDIYNAYLEGLKGNDFSAAHQNIGNNIIKFNSTMNKEHKNGLKKALLLSIDMERYSRSPVMGDRYPDYTLLALADLSPENIPNEAIKLAEYFTSKAYNPKKKNYDRVIVPSAVFLMKAGREDQYLVDILKDYLDKKGDHNYSAIWLLKYLRNDISKARSLIHRDELINAILTLKKLNGYEAIIYTDEEIQEVKKIFQK